MGDFHGGFTPKKFPAMKKKIGQISAAGENFGDFLKEIMIFMGDFQFHGGFSSFFMGDFHGGFTPKVFSPMKISWGIFMGDLPQNFFPP